jgi:lambda family phage portal protein
MGFYVPQNNADTPTDLDESREQTDTGHLIREMEPGIMETLPQGYDYKPHDPAYPTGEIKPFMQVVLQGAAAGLDVSYPTLANDLSNVNFSSLRAGKGEERDEWRDIQQWIIEALHDRVFERWLPLAFLSGQTGNLPVSKIDKFMQPRWRPRGWAYVSPGEEANANQREMSAMIRSPQQIVAERGEDLETVFADIAAAKELALAYGLDFNPQPPGHENTPPDPNPAAGA